ncbi:zinc ribbon domain-containing protein [Paraoerskovia marina]|uniref:zinc ribbon domain-containing protein n=1 Tax=Paraoerskovia marina TaxID=545619 RepID=UPI0004926252|nr:hypothetical protein [Paraoerskovia marina]
MTTAPPEDQHRLLAVQDVDIRIQQLEHKKRNLPVLERIAELDGQLSDLSSSLVQSRTRASDLRRELTKAEGDVEQVRTRAARDQSRLDSGQVGAKDAQALMSELETLGRRQEALEEVELEVMERLEAHTASLQSVETAHAELEAARTAAVAERDAETAEIDRSLEVAQADRARAVEGIDAPLLALYDKVRAKTGGRGVVALKGSFLEGLNLNLAPAEVAEITAAAPETVVRLEDHGHIVVRGDF